MSELVISHVCRALDLELHRWLGFQGCSCGLDCLKCVRAQEDTSICSLNSPTPLTAAKSSLRAENWLCLAEFPALLLYMLILENKNLSERGRSWWTAVNVCVSGCIYACAQACVYEGRTSELYPNPPREDHLKGIHFFLHAVFLKPDHKLKWIITLHEWN